MTDESPLQALCITCDKSAESRPAELWPLWAQQHAAANPGHRAIVSYQRVIEYEYPAAHDA